MGGESSMANSVPGEAELFKSRDAQLFLIDGDESVLMQSGDFVFLVVKHAASSLAAVVAMVGDVQWPVGKDSAVTKEGEASFCFSLPGPLMYGLVLASTTPAADLHRFAKLLEKYSAYTFLTAEDPESGTGVKQGQEVMPERQVALDVEGASPLRPAGQQRAEAASAGAAFPKRKSGEEVSPRMLKRMQQARIVSAVAKLLSKTLEKGRINASIHVETVVAIAGSPSSATDLAVASVDAVAKVVEAVETAGRTLLESAGSAGTDWAQKKYGQEAGGTAAEGLGDVGRFINPTWTLNKLGLRMLFRVIAASMAINSGGSSSSRSGSTSSSDIRRLLSSSSSSSSFSSRSPVTPSYLQGATDCPSHKQQTADSTSQKQQTAAPPPAPPTSSSVRSRHPMVPPPSPPLSAAVTDSPSSSFRLYKPRPAPATTAKSPPFLPRPPPRPNPPS